MLGTKQKDDFESYWQDEKDWLCIVEFLPTDNSEARLFAADIIGYLVGYANLTNTRSLALLSDLDASAYELLFSFSSPEEKTEFQDSANRVPIARISGLEVEARSLQARAAASPSLYCRGDRILATTVLRYSIGDTPTVSLNLSAKIDRDMPARRANSSTVQSCAGSSCIDAIAALICLSDRAKNHLAPPLNPLAR